MQTQLERAVYNKIDMTGSVIGSYTVLGKVGVKKFPSGNSHHVWRVQCQLCNNVKDTQAQHVMKGKYGCKDCKGAAMSGIKSCHWRGGLYVPANFVAKIKFAAVRKSRTIYFDLTYDYLDSLWIAQDGCCAYTGWKLEFDKSGVPGSCSLDRIDSSSGYVEGNVQFVHKDVNVMKWNLSDSRFREICTAIHKRGNKNAQR